MDFCTVYPTLGTNAQARFRETVTRLLAGDVVTPGGALTVHPDWRFLEQHQGLVDSYLRIGGWALEMDAKLQLARAYHVAGAHRVRFNKATSMALCAARLVYHRHMGDITRETECRTTAGELLEQLRMAAMRETPLSLTNFKAACRKLRQHRLLDFDRGFTGDDADTIVIRPLIEKVITNLTLEDFTTRLQSYTTSDTRGEEAEDDMDDTSVAAPPTPAVP